VRIYILTADTQGTANEEILGMNVELIKIRKEDSKRGEFDFLKTLNFEMTVAIGNGSNNQLILKEAALGIAVLGDEGVWVSSTLKKPSPDRHRHSLSNLSQFQLTPRS
jgi:soluble P-type ATPase